MATYEKSGRHSLCLRPFSVSDSSKKALAGWAWGARLARSFAGMGAIWMYSLQ
jgi:hypothetical protein